MSSKIWTFKPQHLLGGNTNDLYTSNLKNLIILCLKVRAIVLMWPGYCYMKLDLEALSYRKWLFFSSVQWPEAACVLGDQLFQKGKHTESNGGGKRFLTSCLFTHKLRHWSIPALLWSHEMHKHERKHRLTCWLSLHLAMISTCYLTVNTAWKHGNLKEQRKLYAFKLWPSVSIMACFRMGVFCW